MRYILNSLIIVGLISLVSFDAQADSIGRLAVSLCDYSKNDDRNSIRKKVKSSGMKLRKIYSGIKCGGDSLLRVAISGNAMNSASYLVKKVGKKNINKPESDGKTPLEWTKALVDGGDASKQPFLDLLK